MKLILSITLLLLTLSIPANAETITLTASDDASVRDGVNAVYQNASWLEVFDSNSIPPYAICRQQEIHTKSFPFFYHMSVHM